MSRRDRIAENGHRRLDEQFDTAVERVDALDERILDDAIQRDGLDAVAATFESDLLLPAERALAARYRRTYPWLA